MCRIFKGKYSLSRLTKATKNEMCKNHLGQCFHLDVQQFINRNQQ